MKKRLYIFILFFLFAINYIICQEHSEIINQSESTQYKKNFFGVNAGSVSGLGFAYRRVFNTNSLQLTFLPVVNVSADGYNTDDFAYFSIGFSYYKEISKHDNYSLLFYSGSHITNIFTEYYAESLGCGFGLEFNYDVFKVNLLLGYAGYDILNDVKSWPAAEIGGYINF